MVSFSVSLTKNGVHVFVLTRFPSFQFKNFLLLFVFAFLISNDYFSSMILLLGWQSFVVYPIKMSMTFYKILSLVWAFFCILKPERNPGVVASRGTRHQSPNLVIPHTHPKADSKPRVLPARSRRYQECVEHEAPCGRRGETQRIQNPHKLRNIPGLLYLEIL